MEERRRDNAKQLALAAAGSVILAILLGGCAVLPANWKTTAIPFNPTHGKGRLIDAKLRAIISAKRGVIGSDGFPKIGRNGRPVTDLAICAEPSPDALQATVSMLGIKVSGEKALESLFSEEAASIGLRTQTIQLLRDAYYRLCEAYLNDGIDAIAYDVLQRRFQNQIIALLAVEQLTGAVQPEQANAQVEEEQAKNETKSTEALQKKEKQLKTAKSVRGTAASNGGTNNPGLPLSTDVVNAVRAITLNAINQDYEAQVCFETLRVRNNVDQFKNDVNHVFAGGVSDDEIKITRNGNEPFAEHCEDLFTQQAALREGRVGLIKAHANAVKLLVKKFVKDKDDISSQDVALLLDALSQAIPAEPGVAFLPRAFRPGQRPISVSRPTEPTVESPPPLTEDELRDILEGDSP